MEINRDKIEKLIKSKKIQKHLRDLQKIVDTGDDGLTSISISCGDSKIEFRKSKEAEND